MHPFAPAGQDLSVAWRRSDPFSIRSATIDDLADLPVIERDAGELFRTLGMDAVADDEPPQPEDLLGYVQAGRAWVAVDRVDRPVGYLIVDVLDGVGHIEQVSVRSSWSRRGIGRALIERATAWATQERLSATTLTTFSAVPWNGPYYQRLGFRYLAEGEIGPELAAIRAEEIRHGLDAWPRACMRRDV
jgi:GNAT superfamily N-acetyltransferase